MNTIIFVEVVSTSLLILVSFTLEKKIPNGKTRKKKKVEKRIATGDLNGRMIPNKKNRKMAKDRLHNIGTHIGGSFR